MNKTITVQKTKCIFSSSASISDELHFPSYDKTTTTVRITIHNKCNRYSKSENEHRNEQNQLLIHTEK